jgi:hypothetical protein
VSCYILTSTALAKDEVVGAEERAKGTSSDSIHSSGLEIDEDGTRNIFVGRSLVNGQTCTAKKYRNWKYLIEVNIHALKLEV